MDEVIRETADKYKPHILALYCYDVAVSFNSFYVHTPKILEESNEHLKQFRLTLIKKTTDTLNLGFSLLGIDMPSEM
jgi:arginyl-tRNA synthetase